MKIAVVILNWNGLTLLQKFLPSVFEHSKEKASIYIADNGSTDESLNYVRSAFPQIKIIELEKNLGFAKGYNEALKQVPEDIYVILNSDVEVTAGWLDGIITFFDGHNNAVALQPTLLDYKNKDHYEYAGASGGYIDKNGFVFCRGRLFNEVEKYDHKGDSPSQIFWATGACFIVLREWFWNTNGFDEDFFAHMEEIDICWRLKNLGKEIWYYPRSIVYHLGGGTLGKLKPQKTYLNFRNNLLLITKNFRSGSLFFKIFLRMILDGIAAWKFLLEGNGKHFLAVGKAHFDFYKMFGATIKKRKALKKLDQNINFSGLYNGNVVYDHFISGIKKFEDLDQSKFIH